MENRIAKIKETCLYISDLEATTRFYNKILHFPIISSEPDRHVFFRVGENVLLCFIASVTKNEQVLPPHFAEGKQHIAFEVPASDYQSWKSHLTDNGVVITHEQQWKEGVASFYFEDPDGHVIEIVPPGLWE
jgi:catechol 2,3-dioxygenase-like lactoylglutathione lyase family enzyme